MRASSIVVAVGLSLVVAGSAFRAQAAPLFLNGVVVAADVARARLTIVRTDGKIMSLPVEGDARSALRSVSKGDRVILGGRESAHAAILAAVTDIRKGHAPAGAPAGTPSKRTTGPVTLRPARTSAPVAELRSEAPAPVVVVENVPSIPPAPAGAIPLEIVNNPIPSVPRKPVAIDVVVPPPVLPPGTEATSDAERARAARDFDVAVSVLAVKANALDRRWEGLRQLCPAGATPSSGEPRGWVRVLRGDEPRPADDACRKGLAEFSDLATQLQQQLTGVEATARRAGVLPGRLRESLARVNLDSLS
jgi:hypothetical protein